MLILLGVTGCTTKSFLDTYDTEAEFLSEISNMSSHSIRGLVLDNKNNVYAIGNMFGNVNACETTINGPGHSGLLIKTDKNLDCKWFLKFDSKLDRSVCFISSLVINERNELFVSGLANGALHIKDKKYFDANGTNQSFVVKIDTNGVVAWVKNYSDIGKDFIITHMIRVQKDRILLTGILDEKTMVVFEIDEIGKKIWDVKADDPGKIYHISLAEVGSSIYVASIGTDFLNLREIGSDHKIVWTFEQKTGASLSAVKSLIATDISKGIWIATSFTGDKDFQFGTKTYKSGGGFDGFITQFRNHKQGHTEHITGKGDQIVTGLFGGNRKCLSFGLAHSSTFQISGFNHDGASGLSIIEFNTEKPEDIVYSTFPIVNEERPGMTNQGLYFRADKGRNAYLGLTTIKGENQTKDPTISIGKNMLTVKNKIFNTILVKGVKKK